VLLSKCTFIKQGGERCGAIAMRGYPTCYDHRPDLAEERRRNTSKGGKRGGRGRPLLEVHDVAHQLQALADKVLAGELDRGDAAVCGQLLNYKTRALDVARAWRETDELAREVEEMREIIEARKESRYG
jgi:hypothetical protein